MLKIRQKIVKLKRKLFNNDEFLLATTFRDDNVSSIYGIWNLAEGMKLKNIKYIRRDINNNLILKTKEGTYIATDEYFWILYEVFCCGLYDLDEKYFTKSFFLFDFGTNRAYASLFFAQFDKCKKVFGHEPDKNTFEFAKYNVELNPHLSSKIELYNYGMGASDNSTNIFKIAGRDGVNSLIPNQNNCISKKDRLKMQTVLVSIKNVSDEINTRLNAVNAEYDKIKMILKIDVEGAEYEIFESLCKDGQISYFDLIFGEAHAGLEQITKKLSNTHNLIHHTIGEKTIGFIFEKKGVWE